MSKNIAIITWHTYNNYGGILQTFALRKKLVLLGYENVDIINYPPHSRYFPMSERIKPKNAYEFWLKKKYNQIWGKSVKEKFDNFRNEYISFTELSDTKAKLFKLNDKYDKFICGSDQIWAPTVFDENYFLKFVSNNSKKISYAPSLGLDSIENDMVREKMKQLINEIPCLSVREEQGKKLIKDLTGREAKIVIDPTLLINKKEWNDIFNLKDFNIKDYVLVYCLGDSSLAYKIAKRFNKKIIFIPKSYREYHKYKSNIYIPSPIEFLKLIYNADMVITDSFHGTVFSMNFNVPFITLKRFKDNKISQNSRIYNILKMTGLEDRLFNKNMKLDDLEKQINYSKVNKVLENKRKESVEFLLTSLEKGNTLDTCKKYITNVCTGCGACSVVCPQKCIDIVLNADGFFEYKKDEGKCTNCNLCKKICAQLNNDKQNLADKKLYSFYSKDDNVLINSSSGGFAYELSKWAINNSYKVVGCTYDYKINKAKHIIVDRVEDLNKLSGSKYIQSYTKDAFQEILKLEKAIVICTPCQIASLDNLLKQTKKRDKFILVDLICHGVPSYWVWEKYLKSKRNANRVKFRDKRFGWRTMTITVDGERFEKEKDSMFYEFFLGGNVYDEACYECNYRDSSSADIRIGDFWGPKFSENKKGVSMVIPCTNVGEKVLSELEKINIGVIHEEDIANYFKYQQTQNVEMPDIRKYILDDLANPQISLETISKRYCEPYKKDERLKRKILGVYLPLKKIYKFFMKRGDK